jgi:hypothetical protein
MALCRRFPAAQRPVVRAGRLIWIFSVQPSPLSVTYTVRLEYEQSDRPQVTVVDPPLQRGEDGSLPHVYPGDELCLYFDEFDGTRHLVADTIVPWVSEWLFHYELWLSTGEWHGGGLHPGEDSGGRRRGRHRGRAEALGSSPDSTALSGGAPRRGGGEAEMHE